MMNKAPNWLNKLEQKFGKFAIPNLAVVIVGIQVFGVVAIFLNPQSIYKLILIPDAVLQGEIWRIITFMAVPMEGFSGTFGLIFLFFYLYILYFVVNMLESAWGGFKSTLYILLAWVVTIVFSMLLDIPMPSSLSIFGLSTFHIFLSLFLAVAMLFPEQELLLFFVLPVKFRWLAIMVAGAVGYAFFKGDLFLKIYLALVYANYLLFFGPYHIDQFRQRKRRREFKNQWK